MRSVTKENIAEHTQQVALIAHALAVIGNTYFGKTYDANLAVSLALFHECSEVITGDLPTPIKYFNPQISTAYKKLEKVANDKLVSLLPDKMQGQYDKLLNANKQQPEYTLVNNADKLCAYLKCVEEVRLGNNEFSKAKNTIYAELKNRNSQEIDFFLKNFSAGYELTLDELDK